MRDDDLRAALLDLADDAPTDGDLMAVRRAGLRARRNRVAARMAAVALALVGTGLTLSQLAGGSLFVVNADAADDGVPPAISENSVPTEGTTGDADAVADTGPPTSADSLAPTAPTDPSADRDPSTPTTGSDPASTTASAPSTGSAPSPPVQPAPVDAGDFACTASSSGLITWTDHGQPLYRVYRSTDGGADWTWLGRTRGQTIFTDPDHRPGYVYRMQYDGLGPPVPCTDDGAFSCRVDSLGTVVWPDLGHGAYHIGRAIDGADFAPLTTTDQRLHIDTAYRPGHRYRVEHDGLDQPVSCTVDPAFICRDAGAGMLAWTDDGQDRYWIYRSVDGEDPFPFIDRADGQTDYVDADHRAGNRYRVNYDGLDRKEDCRPAP